MIEKSRASAFAGTRLAKELRAQEIETLVIAGFTAHECIDASAKQASDLGFTTYVVGDATATSDVIGPDGRLVHADRIHRLVLANLHAMFAKVVSTEDVLKLLRKRIR